MDLLIFILSVFLLFFPKKIEWPIIGMIVLANDYLGIGKFFDWNNLNYYEPKDLGLVLMTLVLIACLSRYKVNKAYMEINKLNQYVLGFFIYLLIIIIIDITINGIDLWSVFRTSRHWLMLLMFIPLMRVPSFNLERVLKILYYLTIVVSFIIVFEFLTGQHFFTEEAYERYAANNVVTRGALPSTYALFYVLLLIFGYGNHNKVIRYTIIALLTFSLLLSATKSIALGLFLGFVISVFLKSKTFLGALSRIFAISLLALTVVAIMPSLRYRLIEGKQNFGAEDDGSVTYRLMMTQERFSYIAKDPFTLIFGIGNVTEDHFQGIFQIGLLNQKGKITQLDTGDIAWALSFLRLGILGTLVWIGIFVVFIRSFLKRRNSPFSIPLISYLLLNLLVLSLAGTTMYFGSFWVVPLICLNIVYPNQNKYLLA